MTACFNPDNHQPASGLDQFGPQVYRGIKIMSMEILDNEGNKVDLPLEGVENITQLSAKIKELQEGADPNWKDAREIIKNHDALLGNAKKNLETLGFELKADGTITKKEEKNPDPTPKDPEAVYEEKEAQKVEKKRLSLVSKASNGDANRANVIEEQYNRLKGGKVIADEEEMEKLMVDAVYLADKERNAAGGDPMHKINSPAPGSGPERTTKVEKEKSISQLKSMGYRFKTKNPEKELTQ